MHIRLIYDFNSPYYMVEESNKIALGHADKFTAIDRVMEVMRV